MRTTFRTLFLGALIAVGVHHATAQCGAGEQPVTITLTTDAYGNETYWQLVPTGSACGSNTIFTGGNMVIGCAGGGAQNSPAGGYANNSTVVEGPFCLTQDATYDILSLDAYGDDQAAFNVTINGASIGQFQGPGGNNVYTFTVHLPEERDMGVSASTTSLFSDMGNPITVKGTVHNFGVETITSFNLSYRFGNGPATTMPVNGVSIVSGADYAFIHSTTWAPAAAGTNDLHIWSSDLNGNTDLNALNDTLRRTIVVNAAIPDLTNEYLAANPTFDQVANSDQDLLVPRDLDFHPDRSRNELWVINKDVENSGGSTVKFTHPGEADQDFLWQRDQNAWHFMSLPTGIAMGDNGDFATSPGVFDANHNGGTPFTGPTLWSTDPNIYAQAGFGPLGSHLDMVHVEPNSQGIAHDQWNKYWVVDGFNGDIVMNDFRSDHGPGNDYHGNAVVRRYSDFTITRDPNDHVVSHCVLDKHTGWLYVVDHGGQRVLRMDTHTGTVAGPGTYGPWEAYTEYSQMTGYTWGAIITTGLDQPAGIDVIGTHLLVSDYANGDIILYDISGSTVPEIGRIHTGAGGIMGIKVGPDGRIWYVNATNHTLTRIDPAAVTGISEQRTQQFRLYPNPVSELLFADGTTPANNGSTVELADATGRICLRAKAGDLRNGLNVSTLATGSYSVRVAGTAVQQIIISH